MALARDLSKQAEKKESSNFTFMYLKNPTSKVAFILFNSTQIKNIVRLIYSTSKIYVCVFVLAPELFF